MHGMTRGWWMAAAVLAILILPGLTGPASAASSYRWTLTCNGSHGGAATSWDWLQNGQVISGAGGKASCGDRGHGTRPPDANGITASLTVWVSGLSGGGSTTKNATLSFDPANSFELRIDASVTAFICYRSPHGGVCGYATEDATFDLTD
jgi:hypothetical protein